MTKTTFEDLARLIVTDYEANDHDTLVRVEQHLEHLRAKFGGNLAVAITADRIGAYKAERKKAGAANATINRELACLKHSFRLAANVRRVGFVPHIEMLKEVAAR